MYHKHESSLTERINSLYKCALLIVSDSITIYVCLQAIDKLPLVPGVLELVGIGYTGVSNTKHNSIVWH